MVRGINLAFSLGIGVCYQQTHERVEGTSAAWTIASYAVTAGAFIIAMIAILTALKDGKHTAFPNRRSVTRRLCKRIATSLPRLPRRNQYDSNFVAFSVFSNQSKRFVLASGRTQLPCLSFRRSPEISRLDLETGNITSSFTLSLTTISTS